MKIIDAIPVSNSLHKVNLVENAGQFSIVRQAVNRPAVVVLKNMTREAAKSFWWRMCMSHFYGATHNLHDAERMADRRVDETIH
ncbi:MAG: hypothetical protein OHM77_00735 [Candidatus Nitricoxidivorans perseverans]|uniref:Uncharacterized protein n=1 Tax=Candidatus Nitricoxidivorans perseverans TaxID=2975601 RepID=A0AA49IVN9_9PROT|nr:MAG: hypothetical protein OHM77_00735 [Candidatus Nitricoxidivorans perseverans]